MSAVKVVSMSGGKDSTACALLALQAGGDVRFVFADTGNEHPLVYEYLTYLEIALEISIVRLKRDFTEWMARRREYVTNKWPEKGVPQDVIERALTVLHPTGNPYLDLCLIKGRFPSRKAQYCTQFLKTEPLVEHQMDIIDAGHTVESWQGVRAEESLSRSKLPEREDRGGGLTVFRPILRWKVAEVFALHHRHGIQPNPLYKQGMGRVGCMPCINANKGEVLEISKRFPEQVERIAEWERLVSKASKRGNSTFIPAPGDSETAFARGSIRQVVEWSKTSRGGKQYRFDADDEPAACASAYGLCE